MTMNMSQHSIPAGEFKARCLQILDQVEATGESMIITKRGRPVARIVPLERSAAGSLRNSVAYHADITEPLDEAWEAEQ